LPVSNGSRDCCDENEVARVRQILIAAAVGLAVTLLGTPIAIRLFRIWGWGQRIREDGPHTHLEKMGTPTMGGTVILVGILVAYLVTRAAFTTVSAAGISVLLATLLLGVIGFIDDYIKVRRRRSLGLSKTAKVIGQAIAAILFAVVAVQAANASTELSFVRDTGLDLGLVFYAWVFVILVASSNAVNLTDGLDGLASGSSILVLSAFVFIAFWQYRHSCELASLAACYPVDVNAALDIAIVAAAAVGAAAGFLWWNAAPARIFMGDTGSLALGGLMGALAVVTSTQLLLVVLGGLFVIETTSVVVQVIAYRGFGRRVFRMTPIHHHFELAGWPEFTVIVRFWIVTGLCVAVGIGLFYADFLALGGTE
jgi:phospho-N-acetylmuramoyl-pentapeptide-transferase